MTVGIVRAASHDGLRPDTRERADSRHEEAAWVAGIRTDKEDAFAEAFRAYLTPLVRSARRIVSSEAAAQDIVMEVFLKLWRTRRSLPADLRLRAYLHVAVRNAALDAVAHARVEALCEEHGIAEGSSPAMGTPELAPDAAFERAEAKEAVRRAYLALPRRLRQVIELRWFEGQSYQEIARALDVSVKSVDNYLAKGMRLLREALKDRSGR